MNIPHAPSRAKSVIPVSNNGPLKQRFTRGATCPVCGGCDDDPRGAGKRCFGYIADDWINCTREDHSAGCKFSPTSETYSHRLKGRCPCGTEHNPADPGSGKKILEKIYQYRDAHGHVVHETLRYRLANGEKKFTQRRPDPDCDGGWRWKEVYADITPVLYRLPELLAAAADQPVWIVEGEKDADNLAARGLLVTTNPMGALKWRDHYSEALVGRDCRIIPDNDPPEKKYPDGKGRRHAQQVAQSLQGKAASVRVVELPGLPKKGDVSDWLARGGTVAQLEDLASKATEWTPSVAASRTDRHQEKKTPESLDKRPTITITTQEQDVNDQIIAALADDPNLYRHGFSLATILYEGDPPRGVEYLDGPPPQIASIEPATLRERMSAAANWFAPKRGSQTEVVPAHPPDWSVQAVHKRGVWRGIRPIVGIIEAPTIRPDGSILCVPGYDRVTRLFYRPNTKFESIPEFPTEQDAKQALDDLLDLLTEFPFKDDTHRAVWLAGLLTVICRASFSGEVPLFAYDGNCPGAGKSKLVDLISIIASGRRMPRTIWPAGNNADEEVRKRITSLALVGERYTLLDNVDSPLGGGPLDAALTGDTWSDRLLCTNKQSGALPLLMTWFASGNNIQYRGDFIRRALQARLESLLENPEERGGWKYPDLNGHVLANRARYVRDALVIVRAFRLLNNPGILPPLGSFEVWTHAIADPVMWIYDKNVFDVRPAVKAGDTASQLRAAIVQGWADLPGSKVGLTVAAALKILHDSSLMEPDPYLTLRSALLELSTKNGDLLSAKSLGRILKVMEGRNIGDVYVRSIPIRTGVNAWRSENV